MEGTIICAGSILFFVLLFGFILMMRYLSYKETLALAEKGLVRPQRERNGSRAALIWGVIIAAIGLALTLGLWPLGLMGFGPNSFPLGLGPWMLIGFIPLFFGLGLILVHVLTRENKKSDAAAGASVYSPSAASDFAPQDEL